MDKKSVIGIVLIMAVLIGYSIFTQPSADELAAKHAQQAKEAKMDAEKSKESKASTEKRIDSTKVDTLSQNQGAGDSVKMAALKSSYGAFAGSRIGKEEFINVKTDLLQVTFTNKGAKPYRIEVNGYYTFDKKPLVLMDKGEMKFDINFFSENKQLSTGDFYFDNIDQNKSNAIVLTDKDSIQIKYRLYTDSAFGADRYLEYVYTIHKNSYKIDWSYQLHKLNDIVEANTNSLDFEWAHSVKQLEKNLKLEKDNTTVYYKHAADQEVDYLTETKHDSLELTNQLNWVSFKQQFFVMTLSADKNLSGAMISSTYDVDDSTKVKDLKAFIGLPYEKNSDETMKMHLYILPNKYKILKSFDQDFERQIPLGWSFAPMAWFNKFIVIPVFNFLEKYILNYGIIILLLTLFVKVLLLPIAYKTYLSSAKMKVLKPEIDEISAKFPKSEDAMKKQQATMALYKKAGVSPMAGCVPMLLQFPILIALFRFFPAAFELRQQPFLWAEDLSSYDSIFSWTTQIPVLSSVYGNHISLFTILMTISTILYTWKNMDAMGTGATQMPGMKYMMYLMPIMFLGIFNSYSSGLSYYYFLANIVTFGQQYIFQNFIVNEAKLHAQIQQNKAKNANMKKSKFQTKLEEMAKQRGYKMPK